MSSDKITHVLEELGGEPVKSCILCIERAIYRKTAFNGRQKLPAEVHYCKRRRCIDFAQHILGQMVALIKNRERIPQSREAERIAM